MKYGGCKASFRLLAPHPQAGAQPHRYVGFLFFFFSLISPVFHSLMWRK